MAYDLKFTFFILLFAVMGGCILLQRIFSKKLGRDQYFYMRDLLLLASMMLLALWSESENIRALAACAVLASVAGMAEQMYPGRAWTLLIPLPGFFFATVGSPIAFLSLPDGAYLYLTPLQSILMTTVWMSLFPILFRRLDQVPGLAGHLLSVSLLLMLIVTAFSEQELSEGFVVALSSLAIVAAFWSRLGHQYRQLGSSLASFWGVIVAGVSILGMSKGIAITALMVIPLGFYAVPLVEMSLGLVSHAFWRTSGSPMPYLYSKVIERGVDHPVAVRLVTTICLLVGGTVAFVQLGPSSSPFRVFGIMSAIALAILVWTLWGGERPNTPRRSLWNVKIDGISMNYALSKTMAWLRSRQPKFRYVVTLNALGLCETRRDPEFRRIADEADLTLPDGTGLVWGLKVLGVQVVERIPGIDYMDRLCRLAAVENLPVYLLGGKPGIAEAAAKKLQDLHPGLQIAGTNDGYFDRANSNEIAQKVKKSGTRILFVALGLPAQEKWAESQRHNLDGILAVGVGGSFDIYAGKLKRAPIFWQKIGCEWLYRLFQEPKRLYKDLQLFVFLLLIIREKLGVFPFRARDK